MLVWLRIQFLTSYHKPDITSREKTRYTLAGMLIVMLSGSAASVVLVGLMM